MILFVIYTLALVFLLKILGFFRMENFRGFGLYGVLVVKILLAVILYHYPLDNMNDSAIYLHDSLILSEILLKDPQAFFVIFFQLPGSETLDLKYMLDTNFWSPENWGFLSEKRNVIRINAVFQILGFHNTYVIFLWNALIAVLGLKLFYRGLRSRCNDDNNLLFVFIFLLPSTLIWTSNVTKESYFVFGLGLLFYGLLIPMKRNKKIVLSALGFLVVLMFKQFVGLGLIAGLVLYLVLLLPTKNQRITGVASIVGIALLGTYLLLPKVTERISVKQFDFVRLAQGGIILYDLGTFYKIDLEHKKHLDFFYGEDKNLYAHIIETVPALLESHDQNSEEVQLEKSDKLWYVYNFNEKSGSLISLTPIKNDPIQLLKNIPEALFNIFFRPLPNDPPKSISKWYFILENVAVWSLFIFALMKIRKTKQVAVLTFLFSVILCNALLYGWTTPVLGAIVRYKLPIVLSLIAASWLLLFPKTENRQHTIT